MKQQLTHIYIRQKRRLEFRLRRARLYWRHYDRQFGWLWRVTNGAAALLLFVGFVAIPVLSNLWQENRYQLDSSTIKLVGNTDNSLANKLTYDPAKQEYVFNQAGLTQAASPSDPTAALMKAQAGSGSGDNSLYALELPQILSKGVAYTDTNTGLSFSLIPEFSGMDGQEEQGHLVYPLDGGNQAIYTLKNNGLKEDIVVPFAASDTMTFSYTLNLPDTLQAKIIPGTGDIGIYSADPSLFGNISYGSDADRAKVMKAQVNSPKNHLLFGLPAPVIKAANGQTGKASAKFVLKGNNLSVMATGIGSIHGSFSVDPSVVVTASSDFATGNNEDNIDFGTADQINRGTLTGGTISGGWQSGGSDSNIARDIAGGVAYNGHIYLVGGLNGGTLNTVYYNTLNSDGSLASTTWTSTSTLNVARDYAAVVAYNGYLYAYGGFDGTNILSSVEYSQINTDGSLGPWQLSSNNMALGVCRFGYAVYNGYLYATEGASVNSGNCGNSSTLTNKIQYAQILANGNVGAWSYTTADMSAADGSAGRDSHGTVAYNGYLYIIGGTVTGSGGPTSVYYGALGANGDITSWNSTSSIIEPHYRFGITVYNGYIYITGGDLGTYSTDTEYAPIYANGSLGAWNTTSSFTTSRWGQVMTSYNGYLYIVGGTDNGSLSDTQYAKIDPAGIAGAYITSGNTFTTAAAGLSEVAYNGYLYILGGNAGSSQTGKVYYAKINNDGSIGTFAATTSFTSPASSYNAAVAYNGYLYILGGCSSPVSFCTSGAGSNNSVIKGSINTSTGAINSWSNVNMTTFTNPRQGLAAVAYDGYMYILGGFNGGTYYNDIQYHAIAADGTMNGSWTTVSVANDFATPRAFFGATVSGGKLYIAGGIHGTSDTACNASASLYCSDVQYAPLNPGGGISNTWTALSSFTNARSGFNLTSANGYLYFAAGYNGSTYFSDTQYAKLTSSGTIASDSGCGSAWCSTNTALAHGVYASGLVAYAGYLYNAGGYDGSSYYATIQYAPINNGGPGTLGSWNDSGSNLSSGVQSAGTAVYNGYLYVLGGKNGSTLNASIQYAPINTDGTLGSFTSNSVSLPTNRAYFGAVAYDGYMYIVGGCTDSSCTTHLTDARSAPIDPSDGSIGSWSAASTYGSNGLQDPAVQVYDGYLYVIGGWDGTTDHVDTRYASINSGTFGTWTDSGNNFTNGRGEQSSVIANGYLYILGGNGASDYNDVQYAQIQNSGCSGVYTSGCLGAWNATASFNVARQNAVATVYDGYMYIAAGDHATSDTLCSSTSGVYCSDVQYAPINANGTLGNWQYASNLGGSNARSRAGTVAYQGYWYVVGGYNSSSTFMTTLYAPFQSIPRIGHYSKLIDLGVSATLQSITSDGVLPGGIRNINYRAAGNDGIFGALTNAGAITGGGAGGGGCGGAGSGTRYVWVSLTLDDSYDAAFADSGGPDANVTDFTINYTSNTGHPAPNIRLRGGQYFNSGSLQPLDTCGP